MAIDPITATTELLRSLADAVSAWITVYGDPEKRRLREIRKLNESIEKKKAKIESLLSEEKK